MTEEAREQKCPEGAPEWMATFADLMSLLMCFFVLLLAFSEMDVLKFKQLAGSMKEAFGVQREIKTKEIPKGTSVVAREFSPGKPVPTSIKVIRQQTTDRQKKNLRFTDSKEDQTKQDKEKEKEKQKQDQTLNRLNAALNREIKKGLVEVIGKDTEVVIRIREKGSFPSGSANLNKSFEPVMKKISFLVKSTPGKTVIAGHTDNIPIYTYQFKSNWELSSSRAVSVLRSMLKYQKIDPARLSIQGHAETIPIDSNKTAAGRAKNRRVEIRIIQGENKDINKTVGASDTKSLKNL